MKEVYSILLSLLMVVLFPIILPAGDTDAIGSASVVIELDQKRQTVPVDPGEPGIVTFTGTVTVQTPVSPEIQYVYVTLEATAEGNTESWPVSLPPPLIFSKEVKKQSFSLSVQVPPYYDEMVYDLLVGGTWEYDPGIMSGDIPPTSAVIEGKRIFGCSIKAFQPENVGNQGDMIDIRFRLDNRGNCEDTYTLCVRNENNLMLNDIDPSFPMARVTFCHEENMSLNLSVKIGQSTPLDSYVIEVEMTSEGAQEEGYNETVSSTCNVVLNVVNEREEEETMKGDLDEKEVDAENDEPNGGFKEENAQDANGGGDRKTENLQDVDETPFIGLVPLAVSISLATIIIGKRRRFRFQEIRDPANQNL